MNKIGIIGAMVDEIENYKQGMNNIIQFHKSGIYFFEGIMNGKTIVLCQSGVGKVNAAVTTQILIDYFQVDKIIFTGVAGAINPELEIGDIVISEAAIQHDIDASSLGFEKGTIPFADKSIFKADEQLISIALDASKEITDCNIYKGIVLSGDQFISGSEKAKELYEQFNGLCTEMEGAAVAQVCDMNNIPFIIIRSMSDKSDGSANINFNQFVKESSKRSYTIVDKMINIL